MSLKLTNKASIRQQEILAKLEYAGQGKYAASNLTADAAAKLIDELFMEKKYTTGQIRQVAADYYDLPLVDVFANTQQEFDDPFSKLNKENKR